MAPLTCPHCGVFAEFVLRHPWDENHPTQGRRHLGAWTCTSCKYPITGARDPANNEPAQWWPREARTREYPDVPDHIAEDASEAYVCFSVGAIKASVVMARRAVQAMAVNKGATPKKTLFAQIDELAEKEVITPSMKDVAHEIRLTGNEGAHVDAEPVEPLADLTSDEAEDVLAFMDTLLEHVYQVPARVERLRGKRAEKSG